MKPQEENKHIMMSTSTHHIQKGDYILNYCPKRGNNDIDELETKSHVTLRGNQNHESEARSHAILEDVTWL